jgi:hypothetical protein
VQYRFQHRAGGAFAIRAADRDDSEARRKMERVSDRGHARETHLDRARMDPLDVREPIRKVCVCGKHGKVGPRDARLSSCRVRRSAAAGGEA